MRRNFYPLFFAGHGGAVHGCHPHQTRQQVLDVGRRDLHRHVGRHRPVDRRRIVQVRESIDERQWVWER